MHSITTALENLTRQLSQEDTGDARALRFRYFPLNDAFDAVLSWLASQSSFHTILQQRNGDEEAAVLGAITVFHRSIWRNGFFTSARAA